MSNNFLECFGIHFPENSFSDDIIVDFTLPSYAHINNEDKKVTFIKDIISDVKFDVVVKGGSGQSILL